MQEVMEDTQEVGTCGVDDMGHEVREDEDVAEDVGEAVSNSVVRCYC